MSARKGAQSVHGSFHETEPVGEIERLRAENAKLREALDKCPEKARRWVVWVMKGVEHRERFADSVSNRLRAFVRTTLSEIDPLNPTQSETV